MTTQQWIKHFRAMAQGKIKPNKNGIWILREDSPERKPDPAPVQIVSQTQQAVEQAKRKRQTSQAPRKRQKTTPAVPAKKASIKTRKPATTTQTARKRRTVNTSQKTSKYSHLKRQL